MLGHDAIPPEPIPEPALPHGAPQPPAPMPMEAKSRWLGTYWEPGSYLRAHLFCVGASFLILAGSMLAQPGRYTTGTIQGLHYLIDWFPVGWWAAVFALFGLVQLAAGFLYPKLSKVAVVGGIVLMSVWSFGLTAAWLWDHATAITAMFSGIVLLEHFAISTLLDGRRHWQDGTSFPAPGDATPGT
jgi:hypothetical protein